MRVLVTGRNGQLARSLAELLIQHPDIEFLFAGRMDLDLAVRGSARACLQRIRPDYIINAAAYTSVDCAEDEADLAFRVNADGAGEIAETANSLGARVIQLSTDYVFDGRSNSPYREEDATGPLNIYGASKLEGEEQVRAVCPAHVIVRTSWLMSPFGSNFVRTIMNAARSRTELSVVSDQIGTPTIASDLSIGLLGILRGQVLGETLHLANKGHASWFDVATTVMDECRLMNAASANVRPILTAEWPTKAQRPAYSVLDCSKASMKLGFAPPRWEESIRSVVRRLAATSHV